MTREWRFTALEFSEAWRSMQRDRLPFPLTYRASAATADEHRRDRARASDTVRAVFDRDLYSTLVILAEPDIHVHACGFASSDDMVRIHGGITGPNAAIACQEPGKSAEHGGDIVVTATASADFGRMLASRIPAYPPGSQRPAVARRALVDGGSTLLLQSARSVPDHIEIARLLSMPTNGFGELLAGHSSLVDGRVQPESGGLQWIDVESDGRYLVQRGEMIATTPATVTAWQAAIGMITRAVDA